MKKIISLFIVALMVLSLASCGVTNNEDVSSVPEEQAEQTPIRLEVLFKDETSKDLAGKYTVWTDDAQLEGTYQFRFADDNGIMDNYEAVTKIKLTAGEDNAISITPFNSFNVAPEGATSLVVAESTKIHATYKLPECKINKGNSGEMFAIFSDVHMETNDKGREDHLNKAFKDVEEKGAKFVCITGDVADDSLASQLKDFANLAKSSCNIPFYAVRGNHDINITDAEWKEYTGNDTDYSFERNGAAYIFFSIKHTDVDMLTYDLATPYSDSIDWLESEVAKYGEKNVPIFLFMHLPLIGQAGLKTNQIYGFKQNSDEHARIIELMKKYTMVVFSGHTHFEVSSQETYEDIMVKKLADTNSYTVHLPSAAWCINIESSRKAREGFVAQFNDNKLFFRSINFMNGRYQGLGCFEIDLNK